MVVVQKDPEALENSHSIHPPQAPPPSYSEISYPPIAQPEPAFGSRPPYSLNGYPPNQHTSSEPSPERARSGTPQQRESTQLGEQNQAQLLARCADGEHDATTTFGICGIICAVLLFPIGLICLCIDTDSKCSRCGVQL